MAYLRTIALLLLVFVMRAHVVAQDLIITTKNDSIHCVITATSESTIHYQTIDTDGKHEHSIRTKDVAMYRRTGYFPVFPHANTAKPKASVARSEEPPVNNTSDDRDRWSISLSTGLSRLTAAYPNGITKEYRAYLDQLVKGYHLNASVQYDLASHFGLGVDYVRFFGSHSSATLPVYTTTGTGGDITLSEDIAMDFIGGSFDLIAGDQHGPMLRAGLAIGQVHFRDDVELDKQYRITGNNLGIKFTVDADIPVSPSLLVVLSFGYLGGSIDRFEIDAGSGYPVITSIVSEEISHIDAGAGLRLRF